MSNGDRQRGKMVAGRVHIMGSDNRLAHIAHLHALCPDGLTLESYIIRGADDPSATE